MKKKISIYTLLHIFLVSSSYFSQSDSINIINDKIFQFLEETSENIEDHQLFSIVEDLLNNPVDINIANRKDISRIPFLSDVDISQILSARKKKKVFKSINDLMTIDGLHPDLVILIKPFLYFSKTNKSIIKNTEKNYLRFRSRIVTDKQKSKGFINGKYKGSNLKSYNRFKLHNNGFTIGLLSEKDPGEQSYIDHYSGYLNYKNKSIIKNILIGDYKIEFGQGLAIWSPYSFAKGVSTISAPTKVNRNYIPFSSSEENKFFRGIITEFDLKWFTIASFYSINKIDATIENYNEISNLYLTGYHRTLNEISKKDNLSQTSYGVSLSYNLNDNIYLDLLYNSNKFNKSFIFADNTKLHGNDLSLYSLAHKILLKNFSIIGETSYNGKSYALINNAFFNLTKDIKLLASYRNYSSNYYNLYSNGFGEFNNTQNEVGFYIGSQFSTEFGNINLYYDLFKQPTKSYNSNFPTSGNDFLFHYSNNFNRVLIISTKFKIEEKEIEFYNGIINRITNEIKSNYRIELKYKLDKNFTGKTRFELVNYSIANNYEKGYLTFQDLSIHITKFLHLKGRIILFNTDSYKSRIYEFENDLRGVMNNPPLYGLGYRWYIFLNLKFSRNFNISLKYSDTYKPNENSIGTGNSEIIGNVKNRAGIQFDFQF